jgi:hypothetical protein
MINKGYSYIRAARELVSIRSGISHAKRASREKQAAAPNKRRKKWQNSRLSLMMQNLKSRILSTNTASHLPGWKKRTITSICLRELGSVLQMAVQRIPGSGIAVTSSINMLAPSWGLATSHLLRAASSKQQAASSKLQALEFFVNRFKRQAASFKPQATSGKLQAARAFIKFFISVRVAGN